MHEKTCVLIYVAMRASVIWESNVNICIYLPCSGCSCELQVLMGIKVIKLYAWELPYSKFIDFVRR